MNGNLAELKVCCPELLLDKANDPAISTNVINCISIFMMLAHLSFTSLNGYLIVCVHNDGHAFIESVNDPCCEKEQRNSQKGSPSKISAKCCTDYPLVTNGIHNPHHPTTVFQLCSASLNTRAMPIVVAVISIQSAIPHGPPVIPNTVEQIRTIVILC